MPYHGDMSVSVGHPALVAWLALALTACGGGGTTGPLIAPDPTLVKVAVVDSGFDINDPEIVDRIDSWHVCTSSGSSVECGGSDISDATDDPHGNFVAQVIAGKTVGYSDNASLLLTKATNLLTNEIELATRWAVDQGARVVNYSLYPMHEVDFYLDRTYAYAKDRGVALVMSAGNERDITLDPGQNPGNLSYYTYDAGTSSLFDSVYAEISLVVGAAFSTGSNVYDLHSYSNYPGAQSEIQARFLAALAPVNVVDGSRTLSVNGTSFTAPQVSAALATLLAQWPHLTAQQSTQLLLDTANDQFTGYDPFYFGQGLLDLNAALQPVGTASLVTGASVSGSAYPVASSQWVLPAAFGDAALGLQLPTAVFDSYGRDFRFNLGQRILGTAANTGHRQWMHLLGEQVLDVQDDEVQLRTTFAAGGQLRSSRLAIGQSQGLQMHWQRDRGLTMLRDLGPLPLLSLAGQGAPGAYDEVDEVGLTWAWNDRQRLTARLSRAQGTPTGNGGEPVIWRYETGLQWHQGRSTTVRAGLSVTREAQGLLGQRSTGALALQRSLGHAATLGVQHDLGQGWMAFGSAELGLLQVLGDTLLAGIDPALTSTWAVGLGWQGAGKRWGLALSQPLRVERATARFDLPVGRTLEGAVLREQHSVNLAPSGRQLNLEMAWQQDLNGRGGHQSSLGLHAIYAHDAGHQAGQSDWSLLGAYRLRW